MSAPKNMIDLILPDMTCGHCEKTVARTVHRIDPGAKLEIDLATHRVRIDSGRAAQTFVDALTDEGYPAVV